MRNKQINKFLLMFFLSFTLFFSVSYAEFSTTPLPDKGAFGASSNISTNSCGGYTFNQIEKITYNRFVNGGDDYISVFDTMVENLTANDIKFLVIEPKSSDEKYLMFIGNSNISIGGYIDVNDKLNLFFAQIDPSKKSGEVNRIRRISVDDLSTTYATSVLIDGSPDFGYEYRLSYTVAYSNVDIKKIVYSGGPTWDGTTYFYEVGQVPENPSSNYDLANILEILKKSTEVQDSIYPYLEDYFIIPNGTINDEQVFSIYFYYPTVNLSQFEYVYNDALYYDLDKTSIDGIISKLTYYLGGNTTSNVVKDIQLATLYYNPETGLGDVYYTGTRTFDQLKSFNSKTQPIIYTTKNIAYYSATWGENDTEWTAVADKNKDISAKEILDSEGNIVSPVLPGSSSVVLGDTPLERFINAVQTAFLGLVDSISKGLISFADYLLQIFGENVVTFVFLIVIKSITVLVSSVALVFRFVSFILTLVAIPSSSALLTVDVAANIHGFAFTGLNWGTHFINGLNFIKTIQWNGLGLWTLFEVFVSSLEVVLLVKIVRKHYRTL